LVRSELREEIKGELVKNRDPHPTSRILDDQRPKPPREHSPAASSYWYWAHRRTGGRGGQGPCGASKPSPLCIAYDPQRRCMCEKERPREEIEIEMQDNKEARVLGYVSARWV